MITHHDGVFHIETSQYSYMLGINAYGQPEHLHWGIPVSTADAESFRCHPGLGWGCSTLLADGDSGSCADDKALEWGDAGRGDYRESAVNLAGAPTDFRYREFVIHDGIVKMNCSLPQPHGQCQTFELILEQPGAELHLYYTAFETVLTRRAVLKNTGSTPMHLQKLMSYCVDLPGQYEMMSFHGGWISEMRPEKCKVGMVKTVNESLTGFSSNRSHPGFILCQEGAEEDHGKVYGFNLIYSGNHYACAQMSMQGLIRITGGINPANFEAELAPGEEFETPEAAMCFSDRGFGGISEAFHRFVTENIVPPYWAERSRPVLFNSWEGCMFDFDHKRLLSLGRKASKLGCELFVLDDGWFGARSSDKAGLGDYHVNPKKLPHGLEGLGKDMYKLGLELGLWLEPESVNEDSELYRAHPDWILRDELPPLKGRNQYHLDLTKPEVRDYIAENVGRILDTKAVRYVKWDMNRHSTALGLKAHNYILGLYEVLDRIFTPRPDILLESCASGGNRFDLGMLCFGPQIWCSDNTDPIERLTMQGSYSYFYPQSTFGAHVSASPHAQTLRTTPLNTRGNVSFFGCLGYELDLAHLTAVEEKEIRAQIALYKQYREVFQHGKMRRGKDTWQVSLGGTTLCAKFHGLVHAAPGYETLTVKGLKRNARYRYQSVRNNLRIGQFGDLVKHAAPVAVNPNGALMHIADHRFTMPSGQEEGTVSGSALESGIMLLPRFRGTGYDQNQYTEMDFSSNLYIIEEIRP